MEFAFREIEAVVIPGQKIIENDQDSQNKHYHEEQVAGVEKGFSLEALFQERKIEDDV